MKLAKAKAKPAGHPCLFRLDHETIAILKRLRAVYGQTQVASIRRGVRLLAHLMARP